MGYRGALGVQARPQRHAHVRGVRSAVEESSTTDKVLLNAVAVWR